MYEIETCDIKHHQIERRAYRTIQQRDFWIQWWINEGYRVKVL